MPDFNVEKTDVLVVGCGGAGVMAALEARKHNVTVTMVAKDSAATPGVVGVNAALGQDPRDSPDIHFEDTMRGGLYMSNQKLVRILADEAKKCVTELEALGVRFKKSNGKYVQAQPLGGTFPRSLRMDYVAMMHRHGQPQQEGFLEQLLHQAERRGIKILKNAMITRLLTGNGAVVGACGIDVTNGDFKAIEAPAVVLATGGAGQLFSFSTYPPSITGDGYALAYEVGAELLDMEFFQFEPCVIAYPPVEYARDAHVAIVTTIFRYGAELRNVKGDRFMRQYDPEKGENTQKDVLARAIYSEMRAGRGTQHGVYLDMSKQPNDAIEKWFEKYAGLKTSFLSLGLDLRETAVEVRPAAHSYMGGLKIDEECETSIQGLYAAGEVTGGVHGANRLGGNAGLEIFVFGSRAGKFAAEHAMSRGASKTNLKAISEEYVRVHNLLNSENRNPLRPSAIKSQIQEIMWKNASIIRNEMGLKEALNEFGKIKEAGIIEKMTARNVQELIEACEVRNMLLTGEMLIRSALVRTESRGAHYREDYPNRDDKWLKNIVVRKLDEKMELWTQPVVTIGNN